MATKITEDLYFRLWAIGFAIASAAGDVSTLIFTQYPNSERAKLVAIIFSAVGLITTVALAQSKRAVETRQSAPPPDNNQSRAQ